MSVAQSKLIIRLNIHEIGSEIQTLWNNLGFSLYTAPPACCVVAISDRRKKSEIEVSADWCVTIEH